MPPVKKNIKKKEFVSNTTTNEESSSVQSSSVQSSSVQSSSVQSSSVQSSSVQLSVVNNFPLYFRIKKSHQNIFDNKVNILMSPKYEYPLCEYGFQHFIHQSKTNIDTATIPFIGKKKVWRVFNKYEINIDEHTDTIASIANSYFKITTINRTFCKLWEILLIFNMIDLKSTKITTLHLTGDGSFTHAVSLFRDTFSEQKSSSKKDKYYYFPLIESKNEFVLSDSRVTHLKNLNDIEKCDFITASCKLENKNILLQEQVATPLIITNIIEAIKNQKKNGNFVCKFYETYTTTSIKLIYLLSELYENIHIIKPLTSRQSSSEKYVVCINFKHNDNDVKFKKLLTSFNDILGTISKSKYHVNDIFTDFKLPNNFIVQIANINTSLSNNQYIKTNNMINFINKEIYLGDEYHEKINEQIEGTLHWTKLFLPDTYNAKMYDTIKSSSE